MITGLLPDCESIGRDHQLEVIKIERIDPIKVEVYDEFTRMPRDKVSRLQSWSRIWYDCDICHSTVVVEIPTKDVNEVEEE